MKTATNRRRHGARSANRELKMLRNLIVNHRMMDTDFQDLKQNPITESLKHLQQAWMESEWPTIVNVRQRAIINEHFWMMFETAQHIEHFNHPEEVKSHLIMTIDGLMMANRKEVAK